MQMMQEFHALVTDLLSFIRQEALFSEKPASPAPKIEKPLPPKQLPTQKPQEREKKAPSPRPSSPPLLFSSIQKHLPHIQLTEEVPSPTLVAIVVSHAKDIPLFHNLASAIQDRFCPVKILTHETLEDLSSFRLVLTEETVPHFPSEKQILIAKQAVYENNVSEKKRLWLQICQHLSQKSF